MDAEGLEPPTPIGVAFTARSLYPIWIDVHASLCGRLRSARDQHDRKESNLRQRGFGSRCSAPELLSYALAQVPRKRWARTNRSARLLRPDWGQSEPTALKFRQFTTTQQSTCSLTDFSAIKLGLRLCDGASRCKPDGTPCSGGITRSSVSGSGRTPRLAKTSGVLRTRRCQEVPPFRCGPQCSRSAYCTWRERRRYL